MPPLPIFLAPQQGQITLFPILPTQNTQLLLFELGIYLLHGLYLSF